MHRIALAAFTTASLLAAAPVLAQSAPTTAPVVTQPAPAPTAAPTAAGKEGCAWKKQYTS